MKSTDDACDNFVFLRWSKGAEDAQTQEGDKQEQAHRKTT